MRFHDLKTSCRLSSKQRKRPTFRHRTAMDLDEFSLEKLRLWSTQALKYFLSVRKKNTEGSFDELVARVYAACEEGIPVDEAAERAEKRLFTEYTAKLRQDGTDYPDPTTFEDGWVAEESGRFQWPSIYITDISDYFSITSNEKRKIGCLLNEYKLGKAYRYYSCEWVRQIDYHAVRLTSPIAFLRADVYPSMSLRKKPWKVWIMVTKKNAIHQGGEIKSAYCTCPSGLLGTCNHIAGLLFRIEYAVKTGATELSPTEMLCEWVVPQGGLTRKPGKWRDRYTTKDRYDQICTQEQKKEALQKRHTFQPFEKSGMDRLKDPDNICRELVNLVLKEVPDCTFVLTQEKRKAIVPEKTVLPHPPSVIVTQCRTVSELLQAMQLTDNEMLAIELATRSQYSSPDWKMQRVGRITSSTFYAVHTKMRSLQENQEDLLQKEYDSWLCSKIVGAGRDVLTHAMKHGLALEGKAKRSYIQLQKKQHKKFLASDSGLIVSKAYPFLATSPDLVASCQCHEKKLCEIKCPESIKGKKPSADNLPYLCMERGQPVLSKKHTYYGQIQGQLALTGFSSCDLFIFTEHGSLTIDVTFDLDFWKCMLPNLQNYWEKIVAPRLLKGKEMASTSNTGSKRAAENDVGAQAVPPKQLCLLPDEKTKHNPTVISVKKGTGTKKKAGPILKVYRCGLCLNEIKEEPKLYCDFSAKCDICPEWYHQKCVNIPAGFAPGAHDEWICPKCT